MSKKSRIITNKKKFKRGDAKSGALYVVAFLGVVATFGAFLSGGVIPDLLKHPSPLPPGPSYTCCDSGNGAACHPILEKQFTYNGDQYALLKSNIVFNDLD